MARFLTTLFLVLCSFQVAYAIQNAEFRSTSGSTIRMVGTEKMQFQIQVYMRDGHVNTGNAWWIKAGQSFGYRIKGIEYYGEWLPGGRSILVTGNNGTRTQWDFVRFISR